MKYVSLTVSLTGIVLGFFALYRLWQGDINRALIDTLGTVLLIPISKVLR